MTEATIKIWREYHDEIPDEEPAIEETVEVYEGDWLGHPPNTPPHDADTFLEADDPRNHTRYDILVEADEPVYLFVHTNDSIHDPQAWDKPIEYGLVYGPDIGVDSPFGTEMWGRVTMWVAARDDD